MEDGEVGLLGQLVEVIVRNLDPEVALIQLLQMEDLIVRAKEKRKNIALEEVVKLMVDGEVGLLGQVVRIIVGMDGEENVAMAILLISMAIPV